jgi:hypothetical protein
MSAPLPSYTACSVIPLRVEQEQDSPLALVLLGGDLDDLALGNGGTGERTASSVFCSAST